MTMKNRISILWLVDLFKRPIKKVNSFTISNNSCDQFSQHDFYCEAERPYIVKS
jgi:hypothetical protein